MVVIIDCIFSPEIWLFTFTFVVVVVFFVSPQKYVNTNNLDLQCQLFNKIVQPYMHIEIWANCLVDIGN